MGGVRERFSHKDNNKGKDKTMDKINEFKLESMTARQKSFYGKAKVRQYEVGGLLIEVLVSYNTEVAAAITHGKKTEVFRLYDEEFFEYAENARGDLLNGYSHTTGRHLESFFAYLGEKWGGKRGWTEREAVTLDKVEDYAKSLTAKVA